MIPQPIDRGAPVVAIEGVVDGGDGVDEALCLGLNLAVSGRCLVAIDPDDGSVGGERDESGKQGRSLRLVVLEGCGIESAMATIPA